MVFPKFLLPFQSQANFQSEQFGSYDYAARSPSLVACSLTSQRSRMLRQKRPLLPWMTLGVLSWSVVRVKSGRERARELGEYLSVTSQLTVESRNDRVENSWWLGWPYPIKEGASASTTATATKTSLLKWIHVFQALSRLSRFAENV